MAAVVEMEVFWGRGKVVERQNRHWWGLASSHCQVHDVCSVLHAACCDWRGGGRERGREGEKWEGGATVLSGLMSPTQPPLAS